MMEGGEDQNDELVFREGPNLIREEGRRKNNTLSCKKHLMADLESV
jgi:hypothetical protein